MPLHICRPLWSGTSQDAFFVLDGMLKLHTPSKIMDYIAGQYSVSKYVIIGIDISFAVSDENVTCVF